MTDIAPVVVPDNQDVAFTVSPQWDGPAGDPGLTWTLDNGMAGSLEVADSKLSARLVTNPGNFSAQVVVTAGNGVSDSCTVSRAAGNIVAIGLTATVVPKA